jgi:hypothetical protein
MTVVAEEDWMTAVTATPSSTAIRRFALSRSKIRSSLPPARFASASPIMCMPYRNIANPPIIVKIPKISIAFSFLFSYAEFGAKIFVLSFFKEDMIQ